jgi:hypothetical protein
MLKSLNRWRKVGILDVRELPVPSSVEITARLPGEPGPERLRLEARTTPERPGYQILIYRQARIVVERTVLDRVVEGDPMLIETWRWAHLETIHSYQQEPEEALEEVIGVFAARYE